MVKFYYVVNRYIEYLRKVDNLVSFNKEGSRPYIGIVLEIDGIRYYAPLTSPKPKHKKLKNGKDFRKINHGIYGAINFNNMIPIPDTELRSIDFMQIADIKYRRLLQNQYKFIVQDWNNILKTAQSLRKLVMSSEDDLTPYDKEVKKRCCNLALLEEKCKEYN